MSTQSLSVKIVSSIFLGLLLIPLVIWLFLAIAFAGMRS